MQAKSESPKNFGKILSDIMLKNVQNSSNKRKPVSRATIEKRRQIIKLAFTQLREDGYKLQTPFSLKNRHVQHLIRKWEESKLSASTLQLRISILRTFCEWIGKPGMVLPIDNYLKNYPLEQRGSDDKSNKSWCTNSVDPECIIQRIEQKYPYVAAQLKAINTFGLRRKEAVLLKPVRADKGSFLAVNDGTKGSRDRNIIINTQQKRIVLDQLKAFVKNIDGHLGDPKLSLSQNLTKISNVVRKFGISKKENGVTLDGLRHQCQRIGSKNSSENPPLIQPPKENNLE